MVKKIEAGDHTLIKGTGKTIIAFHRNNPSLPQPPTVILNCGFTVEQLADFTAELTGEKERQQAKEKKDREKAEREQRAAEMQESGLTLQDIIMEIMDKQVFKDAVIFPDKSFKFPREGKLSVKDMYASREYNHLFDYLSIKGDPVKRVKEEYLRAKSKEAWEAFKEKFKFIPEHSSEAQTIIENMVDHFRDPNSITTRRLDIAIFTAFFLGIKRKIFGVYSLDDAPVSPYIYGAQAIGKSRWMLEMLKPVDEYVGWFDPTDLSDRFAKKSMASKLICFFDEMAPIGKEQYNSFKKFITSKSFDGRDMHDDFMYSMENDSSVLCCSNIPLSECFHDVTGLRRFAQFTAKVETPKNIAQFYAEYPIDSIRFDKLYTGIDENLKNPLSNPEIKNELAEAQETWESNNVIKAYVQEYGFFVRVDDEIVEGDPNILTLTYDTIYVLISKFYAKFYGAKQKFTYSMNAFVNLFRKENVLVVDPRSKRHERIFFKVYKDKFDAKDKPNKIEEDPLDDL